MSIKTRLLFASFALVVFTFGFESESHAQRGVRIGNFFQAGGGQGFRLGGPRGGMHFGGGQGASIGTSRFGMRFGNGQGARFGGQKYGMQFGGGQGTQIGRFATVPNVTPGTYYYGTQPGAVYPQQNNNRQSNVAPSNVPTNQPTFSQQPGIVQRGSAQQTVGSSPTPTNAGNTPTPSGTDSNSKALTNLANPQTPTKLNPPGNVATPTPGTATEEGTLKDHAADAPGQRKTKVYSILNKEPQELQKSSSDGSK